MSANFKLLNKNTCNDSLTVSQMKQFILKKKLVHLWFIKHTALSTQQKPWYSIWHIKEGTYKVTWLLLVTMKRHSWLSNRITVKVWHPVCQLRFFRGRCKTHHNTCPLTVQYYTTMEKNLPRLVVPNFRPAYFFCISLQAMQIFTWFYFPKQILQLFS